MCLLSPLILGLCLLGVIGMTALSGVLPLPALTTDLRADESDFALFGVLTLSGFFMCGVLGSARPFS